MTMIDVHKILVAQEIVRHTNIINKSLDFQLYLLEGFYPIRTSIDSFTLIPASPVVELKVILDKNLSEITNRGNNIKQFGLINDTSSLSIIEKDFPAIDVDITKIQNDASNVKSALPLAKDSPALNNLKSLIVSDNKLLPEIHYSQKIWYIIMLNDLLDAMSYYLRNLLDGKGTPAGLTIEEIKSGFSRYTKPINGLRINYPASLTPSVNTMIDTASYVEEYLKTTKRLSDALILAHYIDSNVPKLPLMRRLWAHG